MDTLQSGSYDAPPPCTPAERKRAEELGEQKAKRYYASKHFFHNPHTKWDGSNPTYKGSKEDKYNGSGAKTKVADK